MPSVMVLIFLSYKDSKHTGWVDIHTKHSKMQLFITIKGITESNEFNTEI